MSHDHDHHDHHDHHGHHGHDDRQETYSVRGGAPVLDIGGEIGALVVLLDDAAVGEELFLRRDADAGSLGAHTGIWHRRFGDAMIATAVFMALQEGVWWILRADGTDQERVEIIGSEMLQLDRRSVLLSR